MDMLKDGLIKQIAGILLLVVFTLSPNYAWSVDERHDGPGRLPDLIDQSDFIMVAEFSKEESQDDSPLMKKIHFSLVKGLMGDPIPQFVILTTSYKRIRYAILQGAERILLFLKETEDGKIELTFKDSAIRLEGNDSGVEEIVERYIAIRRSTDRKKLLKSFIFENLSTSHSDYIKETLAEDFWGSVEGRRNFKLSEEEHRIIIDAALASQSAKTTEPLCLVLDSTNSDQVVDGCLHSLLNTDGGGPYRLAGVIAKRKKLLDRFLLKLQREENKGKLSQRMSQLYLVPDDVLIPKLRELWTKNPVSRSVVEGHLKMSARTEKKDALLNEFKEKKRSD